MHPPADSRMLQRPPFVKHDAALPVVNLRAMDLGLESLLCTKCRVPTFPVYRIHTDTLHFPHFRSRLRKNTGIPESEMRTQSLH